jgi:hypothetical protein
MWTGTKFLAWEHFQDHWRFQYNLPDLPAASSSVRIWKGHRREIFTSPGQTRHSFLCKLSELLAVLLGLNSIPEVGWPVGGCLAGQAADNGGKFHHLVVCSPKPLLAWSCGNKARSHIHSNSVICRVCGHVRLHLQRSVKLSLFLTNKALHHEDVWGGWIYRSTFSLPRH